MSLCILPAAVLRVLLETRSAVTMNKPVRATTLTITLFINVKLFADAPILSMSSFGVECHGQGHFDRRHGC